MVEEEVTENTNVSLKSHQKSYPMKQWAMNTDDQTGQSVENNRLQSVCP